VADKPVDFNMFYRGGCAVLPLFLLADGDLFNAPKRMPNISPAFVDRLIEASGVKYAIKAEEGVLGPHHLLGYIYALLYSTSYRERYREFLKVDFPRVPITGNAKLLNRLITYGQELIDIHLRRNKPSVAPNFPVKGSGAIDRVEYDSSGPGKVWINDKQYFGGVGPDVWAFEIGGYRVAEKWLKSRIGLSLDHDQLVEYKAVCGYIHDTLTVMAKIESAIVKGGGWPFK
jgi:hypothetical protein